MVAHLDAVTALAVDPNGLYILSGSKYNTKLSCSHNFQKLYFGTINVKDNFTNNKCKIKLNYVAMSSAPFVLPFLN